MNKTDEAEYLSVMRAHGRRVANRWLVVKLKLQRPFDLKSFYLMYGNENDLPEDERGKTLLLREFDPCGFLALYPDGPRAPLWPQPGSDEAARLMMQGEPDAPECPPAVPPSAALV